MIKPNIHPNKHLGIIFQPRSGSTVMRHYLSELLERINLGEWFNANSSHINVTINGNFVQVRPGDEYNPEKDTEQYVSSTFPEQIETLNRLSAINKFSVFGIYAGGYRRLYPDGLRILQRQQDIQFIQLERADVLYSLLSRFIARDSEMWHNVGQHQIFRDIKEFVCPMDELKETLLRYVKIREFVLECFGPLPTVYYEQFQFNLSEIRNMFSGIPNKLISVPITKFAGNHKDLIVNIDEVESYYEEFVNKHREHFPQYFGKIPSITIPASQGKQPRELVI